MNKNKFWRSFLHPNTGIFFTVVFFNIFIIALSRLIFLIKYSSFFRGIKAADVLAAFINGFRFDISTTFLIFSLFFVILFLPAVITASKIFRKCFFCLTSVILLAELWILTADIGYYGYVKRHLSREAVNFLSDSAAMLKMILIEKYIYVLIWLAATVLAARLLIKLMKKNSITSGKCPLLKDIARSLAYFFMTIVISVIAVRGGFQSKPLRVANAFINDSIVLGHLSLNGVYTMMKAFYKKGDMAAIPYDYKQASQNMRSLLGGAGTEFLDGDYPLFRKNSVQREKKKFNIVIFIMESWSADSVGSLGGNYDLTPNFDRMARGGALFTNFFSVGQRSVDAALSILFSFPSFAGLQTSGSVYEQNQMVGLAKLLRREKYSTIFVCGANRGSMGFDSLAKKCGFEKYIAKDDFDLPKECFDGTWGVFDEYAFLRAHEEFEKAEKPFLGVIYSLNPHAPYKVPSDKFIKVKEGKEAPFYNALYYSDWALGKFMEEAQKSDYAKNTLFIIVGDHPEGHHELTMYDSFRVPCLFYYPEHIAAAEFNFPSGQLDIFPSILDMAAIGLPHASFGKSLFGKNTKFAIVSNGNVFGWLKGDFAFLRTIDKPVGFYKYMSDKNFKNNITDNEALRKNYDAELLSVLKLGAVMLRDNKVAPVRY
ncbi:sulfatase-like hydrolase/transferase [bacterium]|nr:sulfatase-like hydrolase/transferase [bacterium]